MKSEKANPNECLECDCVNVRHELGWFFFLNFSFPVLKTVSVLYKWAREWNCTARRSVGCKNNESIFYCPNIMWTMNATFYDFSENYYLLLLTIDCTLKLFHVVNCLNGADIHIKKTCKRRVKFFFFSRNSNKINA